MSVTGSPARHLTSSCFSRRLLLLCGSSVNTPFIRCNMETAEVEIKYYKTLEASAC